MRRELQVRELVKTRKSEQLSMAKVKGILLVGVRRDEVRLQGHESPYGPIVRSPDFSQR